MRIHLAEIFFDGTNGRIFDIEIEEETAFKNVDIVALGLGESRKAMTLEKPQVIDDGFLSISFLKTDESMDNPKVSALEVILVEDHLAHAVANGPYVVTDTDECKFKLGFNCGQPDAVLLTCNFTILLDNKPDQKLYRWMVASHTHMQLVKLSLNIFGGPVLR